MEQTGSAFIPCYHLDGLHKDIGDDGDTHKAPDKTDQVDEGSGAGVPCVLAHQGQYEALVGAVVRVKVTHDSTCWCTTELFDLLKRAK